MKKLILTSLLTLALAASASAAVPSGGVYLDKDGTPLTEAQQVPPSLRSHKMAPQNAAIQEAMAALPHSTSTLIALTVTEDGTAANASVAQSSGSIILDQYAIDSVNLWQFRPAKRGDRSVYERDHSAPLHLHHDLRPRRPHQPGPERHAGRSPRGR